MSSIVPTLLRAGFSVGLLAAAQVDRMPSIIWNTTESVPVGLYFLLPLRSPSLGELVAVRLPKEAEAWMVEHGYVGADTLLLKRLAAVSGMTVCRDGLAISIDGSVLAHAALTDRSDRPLPDWTGCITLGSDEVFLLLAGVPDSLDGRYFGPLAANAIVGRAVPVWTSGGPNGA
jgi:conjugative transfer signal peptidase TraF